MIQFDESDDEMANLLEVTATPSPPAEQSPVVEETWVESSTVWTRLMGLRLSSWPLRRLLSRL